MKTAWEIAIFFVDPRTEDDVVYHPLHISEAFFLIVFVLKHHISAAVQVYRAGRLLPLVRGCGGAAGRHAFAPLCASCDYGVLLCLKKNSFRRKNNGFIHFICNSNTYIKCGGFT